MKPHVAALFALCALIFTVPANAGANVISGYIPVRGARPGVQPSTQLTYYGGSVLQVPAVYVTFWGYKAAGDPDGVKADLVAFLRAVGGSSWENTLTQYYGPGGNIENPKHQLMGVWDDESRIPKHPTDAQIAAEAAASVKVFGFNPNAAYIVATAQHHDEPGFGTNFCGYHGVAATKAGSLVYFPIAYMPDAGIHCGAGIIAPSPNQPSADEGVSIVAGIEYADSIAEPVRPTGWNDAGSEVADLCGFINQAQNVQFGQKSFALGGLWSNSANACTY